MIFKVISSDRKRFTCPDPTVFPIREKSLNSENSDSDIKDNSNNNSNKEDFLINPVDFTRQDGRYPEHLRNINVRTGVITRASGSAFLEYGSTKLICSVYGPYYKGSLHDSLQVNCNLRMVFSMEATMNKEAREMESNENGNENENINQEMAFWNESKETYYSTQLKNGIVGSIISKSYPGANLDIFVNVLEDDGGVMAAALTVSSLALIDARIELLDSVIGLELLIIPEQNIILLDPDNKELAKSKRIKKDNEMNDKEETLTIANMTIGCMPNLKKITFLREFGSLKLDTLQEAYSQSVEATLNIYNNVIRSTLLVD